MAFKALYFIMYLSIFIPGMYAKLDGLDSLSTVFTETDDLATTESGSLEASSTQKELPTSKNTFHRIETTQKMKSTRTEPPKTTQPTTLEATEETLTSPNAMNSTVSTDSTQVPSIPDTDCVCDLKKSVCDVNCCCDPDCSSTDRAVFSSCFIQPNYPIDSKYCYSTQFMYKNNTQFKIQRKSNGGLFCVLADNFPGKAMFGNFQIFRDVTHLKKLQGSIKRYSWPNQESLPSNKYTPEKFYKSGSVMLALDNDSKLFPWSLPKNTASHFCQAKKVLSYLADWSSACRAKISSESDCLSDVYNAERHFKNVKILRSPSLFNSTDYESCNTTFCVTIKPHFCRANFMNCSKSPVKAKNFYDKPNQLCQNVLLSTRFEVVHNGTDGIKDINAYFHVENISLTSDRPKLFDQNYDIIFKWLKQSNLTLERSGFPGYLEGKPLISGFKSSVNSTNDANKTVVLFHSDRRHWISTLSFDERSNCNQAERMNILFRENVQTSCRYIFQRDNFLNAEACSNLNANIMEILLGGKVVNNAVNLLVSSLGDPKPDSMNDWVPIVLQEQQKQQCSELITGLTLNIFYAFVGPVLHPQTKVVAITADFQRQSLGDKNQNLLCHFKICIMSLSSSVSFIDTTQSSSFKFAEIPVYEIKLPQDFFYPFFSSANSARLEGFCAQSMIVLSFIIFKFLCHP